MSVFTKVLLVVAATLVVVGGAAALLFGGGVAGQPIARPVATVGQVQPEFAVGALPGGDYRVVGERCVIEGELGAVIKNDARVKVSGTTHVFTDGEIVVLVEGNDYVLTGQGCALVELDFVFTSR